VQGGSVVKFLLQDGKFAVRGLTRNRASKSAKELEKRGVEVVEAELDDVQSLTKAFEGAAGVFAVTNYWEHRGDAETRHGKNMVDAAKANKVGHFILSTMGITAAIRV
jgi:uncharacterized protein YbjT (DUF2867 family)